MKCSEFLHELTNYLDGVLDETYKSRVGESSFLVPQLLRGLRHHQEDHRDLSRLPALRIARRSPHAASFGHHDQVPAAQEARPGERVVSVFLGG